MVEGDQSQQKKQHLDATHFYRYIDALAFVVEGCHTPRRLPHSTLLSYISDLQVDARDGDHDAVSIGSREEAGVSRVSQKLQQSGASPSEY